MTTNEELESGRNMKKNFKTEHGVDAAKGYRASGISCGIKNNGLDLALIVSASPASRAVVATTNRFCAAPVQVTREHLRSARYVRAIVVNSGNANACTGREGMENAKAMSSQVADKLGFRSEHVLVASTGVIGVRLPMKKVLKGIDRLCADIEVESDSEKAAQAILTTDTKDKQSAVRFTLDGKTVSIGGMAKGSGMIAPNMATMLSFITTDVQIPSGLLRRLLRKAADASFNRITVDGDTSTNDTLMVLANGHSGAKISPGEGESVSLFSDALTFICKDLASQIVQDGEGATKTVCVRCSGARSIWDAERVARTVAESLLVKTAIFGNDANWGRIVAALGRSKSRFDPENVTIRVGRIKVFGQGKATRYSEESATKAVSQKNVLIHIDLSEGHSEAEIETCDLSYEYIRINAAYRS